MRRRSRRSLIALGLTAIAMSLPAGTAAAATFPVTKTADSADGTCDADCSLREAIIAANAAAGVDTVTVPAGSYLLTVNGAGDDDTAAEGDLDITSEMSVTGAGPGASIVDGNGTVTLDHVFHMPTAGVSVAISGFTVQNGYASNSVSRNDGGGILVEDGTLDLSNTLVTGSKADDFSGGVDVDGTATLTNVTIAGNTAEDSAGGIEVEGDATLTNVTISGNSAKEDGGGIGMFGNTITLNNVTVTNNTADSDANDTGDGGGIYVSDPTLTVRNSIIAGNTDASGAGIVHPDCTAPTPADLVSQGHNLEGAAAGGCPFTGPGDLVGVAPLLGALADNGGTTPTHALLDGSPAIDAGDPAIPGSGGTACAATDQRGVDDSPP